MAAKDIIQFRSAELYANANVDNFIALADSQTSKTAFGTATIGTLGTKRDLAVALRAMHLMTKDSNDKEGIVQSESEGSVSRSYAVNASLARQFPDLMSTKWGKELAELIGSCVLPALNRMM
jgi:uncharacterized glyoxalase superfamily metalloenzyme YdcJ